MRNDEVFKLLHCKNDLIILQRYMTSLLTPIYNKLGFKDKSNDDHVTLLFRSHVRKWACKFNVTDCKAQALSHFDASNNGAELVFLFSLLNVPFYITKELN